MNVTLPDGTVLQGVPDGTTKAQLREKLASNGYDVSKLPGDAPASATPEVSWGQRGQEMLQGGKARLDEMALGVKGLLPQSVQDFGDRVDRAVGSGGLTKATAAKAPDTWAGTAGGIGADILATAGPAAGLARGAALASRALPMATGRRLLTEAGLNVAGQAGMSAALTPEDRGMAGALGAAGGAVGAGLQRAMGGLVRPITTPGAAEMMRRGVQVTPGQAVGGAALDIEKKLTSVPLAGNVIRRAHERVNEDFFRDTAGDIVRALPGNARTAVAGAGAGNATMTAMREQIGQQYDNALGQVAHVPINATALLQSAVGAVNDPGLALTDASKQRVLDYVANNVLGRNPAGAVSNLSGEAAKRIESDLGKVAANWTASSTAEERSMGQALGQIHQLWRGSVTQAVNAADPTAGAALRNADQAWRAFLPLDRASATMGAQSAGGTPQPRALLNALKALDKSQNDNALRRTIAQGRSNTPYDRLVQNQQLGADVLGDAVPDSGTTGRWLAGSGLAALAASTGTLGQAAAGLAGTAAAYSRLGSRLLTQGVAPQQVEKIIQAAAQRGIPEEALLAQVPNVGAAAGRAAN